MSDVVIRSANQLDAPSLWALAQLDSAPDYPCEGELLLAEVDGRIVAAWELASRRVVADPFEPTAALIDLLSVRARQLAPPRRARRLLQAVRAIVPLRAAGPAG